MFVCSNVYAEAQFDEVVVTGITDDGDCSVILQTQSGRHQITSPCVSQRNDNGCGSTNMAWNQDVLRSKRVFHTTSMGKAEWT